MVEREIIGMLIAERFRVREELARGGMSQVYLGDDQVSGTEVAIKLLPERLRTENSIARFRREVRLASLIADEHVIQTLDGGILTDGTPYLVMEFLRGRTLHAELRLRAEPLPWAEAQSIALQLLHGLGAAHSRGVVHRDLKPSNVFLTSTHTVKLIDFGLSKDLLSVSQRTMLTGPEEALGTPSYMAPEQILAEPVDERTDIWGAGALLYEMVTGRQAFPSANMAVQDVFSRILEQSPPPPSSVRPDLPYELDEVVAHALRREKRLRFASASAMADAIATIA